MEKILLCSYDARLIPQKHSDGAVCWDLHIADDADILPGQLVVLGTGIKVFFPIGWHAKIYARSGLPVKKNLMLANAVAVMDADYRGEYFVQLYNFGPEKVVLEKYTRVAQMEILPYYQHSGVFGTQEVPEVEFTVDPQLYANFEQEFPSARGTNRFHSTGD